jgi:hypothetical protein
MNDSLRPVKSSTREGISLVHAHNDIGSFQMSIQHFLFFCFCLLNHCIELHHILPAAGLKIMLGIIRL